jgi:prepilin-type N-terminal cleavage/methylation domain-containing protein/prepilin-type processing-associated H-X9-DG protein
MSQSRNSGLGVSIPVTNRKRSAFTLVELLVVISIIGVLMSLLLPAVNSAREAGRKTQCMNNLKNLGQATQQSLEKFKRFPTGGWGPEWVGWADGGMTTNQPGGWIYNLLPYLEQTTLHDVTAGTTNMPANIVKELSVSLAILNCPSRRGGQLYPSTAFNPRDPTSSQGTQITLSTVPKSDYAANAGVRYDATSDPNLGNPLGVIVTNSGTEFPTSVASTKSNGNTPATFKWPAWKFTGVIFQQSTVSDGSIKDGLSHTYLCGEKFVSRRHYEDGLYPGDQGNALSGMGSDNYRGTYVLWTTANTDPLAPTDPSTYPSLLNDRDDPNFDLGTQNAKTPYQCVFGGPHSGIVNFAFCDGSTKSISTAIDPLTHRYLGERSDGKILDDGQIGN